MVPIGPGVSWFVYCALGIVLATFASIGLLILFGKDDPDKRV